MPRIHLTPVVLNLIIINVLVFIACNLFQTQMEPYFLLIKSNLIIDRPNFVFEDMTPAVFQPIQLVTSIFTHFEVWHIAMNMLALGTMGTRVEMVMGPKRFLFAYLLTGVGGALICAFLDPSDSPVVGASLPLCGMWVIEAFYFPHQRMRLIFLPFEFRLRNFVIGFAVVSAVLVAISTFTDVNVGRISHFGHLSGMIVGFLYLQAGKLRISKRR